MAILDEQLVALMIIPIITANIKILIAYCGGEARELEGELNEESWILADAEDVFKTE